MTITDIGPKPKPTPRPPAGPKPRPTRGHLPIGAAPAYPLPLLGQVVRDAEHYLAQALAVLRRDFDPASAPPEDGEPVLPGHVFIRLKSATADVRSAMWLLGQVADVALPAAGSAVPVAVHKPAGVIR